MVLAIEQHVSRPDVGTVRYEETVIATESAPENMAVPVYSFVTDTRLRIG